MMEMAAGFRFSQRPVTKSVDLIRDATSALRMRLSTFLLQASKVKATRGALGRSGSCRVGLSNTAATADVEMRVKTKTKIFNSRTSKSAANAPHSTSLPKHLPHT